MTAQADPIVDARDIRKSFGTTQVLQGVSLEVTTGEVVCIIGPSGGGKSTFLRTLNGLETIDSGSVRVCGSLVGVQEPEAGGAKLRESGIAKQRKHAGMVFQQFNLFGNMNAIDNVASGPLHVLGQSKDQAHALARELLAQVGLADKANAFPSQLSGGQQQRVAIARALAMKPRLMLFDEPTSALDPEMVQEVLDVLMKLREEGMTMILVTHEMAFARAAADRVVLIADGVVAEEAPPVEFFSSPKAERSRQFLEKIR